MMIFHEALGVQKDIADLLTVVLFVVWYLGITVACRKLGEDHLACHIWVEGIITNVAAFTVIEIVHHPIEHFAHPVAHAFPGSAGAMPENMTPAHAHVPARSKTAPAAVQRIPQLSTQAAE